MRLISVYTVYVEKVQSQGRVDCIVETPQYIYIFEFKLDGTADEALQQIEDKGYAREYATDSRKLFRIGAVFSSETGTTKTEKVKRVLPYLCFQSKPVELLNSQIMYSKIKP